MQKMRYMPPPPSGHILSWGEFTASQKGSVYSSFPEPSRSLQSSQISATHFLPLAFATNQPKHVHWHICEGFREEIARPLQLPLCRPKNCGEERGVTLDGGRDGVSTLEPKKAGAPQGSLQGTLRDIPCFPQESKVCPWWTFQKPGEGVGGIGVSIFVDNSRGGLSYPCKRWAAGRGRPSGRKSVSREGQKEGRQILFSGAEFPPSWGRVQ